ncbi:sensor histidine kinase [Sphingobium chlorophenolicum]|uniref:sensor histidine kinase n=1 Tax=Sphingobium chlorophenolicum TaxID=46429 RepID=UPI0012DC9056|nr:HWE histidine kinase domain-containing protein [Sphingobium chlorophenolicum]
MSRIWPGGANGMAASVRDADWAESGLGPVEGWPPSLRQTLDNLLSQPLPAALLWGENLLYFHNDAYVGRLALLHPAFGRPLLENSPDFPGRSAINQVLAGQTVIEDVPRSVLMNEDNPDCVMVLSPVHDEQGEVQGVLLTLAARSGEGFLNARLPISDGYRALFNVLDEGFGVVEVLFDADRCPSDVHFMEVNAAFERLTGFGNAAGRTMRAFASDHDQHWYEICGRVALSRRPERFENPDAAPARPYDAYAFPIGEPRQNRVAILLRDIMPRLQAEAALHANERRKTFLLELSDSLRPLADPQDIMAAAGALLGAHLGADRCGYGEVDAAGDHFTVVRDWTSGRTASARGTYRIDDFGLKLTADQRTGRKLVIEDALADPRTQGVESAYIVAGGLRATLAVPLMKEGRWIACFFVQQGSPRTWTAEEEALLWDVAERTWAAVERARVEWALRDSEKRLRVAVSELQHRVRNILTVVRSVFARTFDRRGDQEEMADHFKGRLDALARSQIVVTQTAAGTADLENLIRDELMSVGAHDGPQVRIEGPDVLLNSKAAESLGLAVHELTTNAVKYGALRATGASLDIFWTVDLDQGGQRMLTLCWDEQGVPAVSINPGHEGFGRELIEEALPYRLGAETKLEFRGGGIRCSIAMPLDMAPNRQLKEPVDER